MPPLNMLFEEIGADGFANHWLSSNFVGHDTTNEAHHVLKAGIEGQHSGLSGDNGCWESEAIKAEDGGIAFAIWSTTFPDSRLNLKSHQYAALIAFSEQARDLGEDKLLPQDTGQSITLFANGVDEEPAVVITNEGDGIFALSAPKGGEAKMPLGDVQDWLVKPTTVRELIQHMRDIDHEAALSMSAEGVGKMESRETFALT